MEDVFRIGEQNSTAGASPIATGASTSVAASRGMKRSTKNNLMAVAVTAAMLLLIGGAIVMFSGPDDTSETVATVNEKDKEGESGKTSDNGKDQLATVGDTGIDLIDAGNVGSLRVAWTRPIVDPSYLAMNEDLRYSNVSTAAPLIIDGVGYVPNTIGLVEAFDVSRYTYLRIETDGGEVWAAVMRSVVKPGERVP